MGYTHYWNITPAFTEDELGLIAADARAISLAAEVPIAYESDQADREPAFTPTLVRFNGIGRDGGHETFYLDTEETGFQFCKTAAKPYDVVVTATLLAAKDRVPRLRLSSDGDPVDWADGHRLAERALGRTIAGYVEREELD